MGLMDLLPDYYRRSAEVVELQGAFQHWTDALRAAREDLLLQLNVSTATWGLSTWEEALGLETDVSKSYAFRRTRIMSKLRGRGTTTVVMIQNVAESFSNGEVAIGEDPANYRFDITFTGTIGTPPNMEDLTAAIEEIKPAHMDYDYIFIYRTHAALAAYTYDGLAGYTYETLREGEM
jgi:hypothetical protein